MYKDFDTMPAYSRIWIYQADRTLSAEEVKIIINATTGFLNSWQSHGKDISCSSTMLYDRVLIVAADEVECGSTECCAIDASVNHIKNLEKEFSISFLDKTQLLFMQSGELFSIPLREIPFAIESKKVTADTLFFDNTINKKFDLDTVWPSKIENTWIAYKL